MELSTTSAEPACRSSSSRAGWSCMSYTVPSTQLSIVLFTLDGIANDSICITNPCESGRGIGVIRVAVGMMGLAEFVVSSYDVEF